MTKSPNLQSDTTFRSTNYLEGVSEVSCFFHLATNVSIWGLLNPTRTFTETKLYGLIDKVRTFLATDIQGGFGVKDGWLYKK